MFLDSPYRCLRGLGQTIDLWFSVSSNMDSNEASWLPLFMSYSGIYVNERRRSITAIALLLISNGRPSKRGDTEVRICLGEAHMPCCLYDKEPEAIMNY